SGRMSALIGQIEATWAALDDEGKARLRPRLGRAAARVTHAPAATRLRKLVTASDGGEVPYGLIDDSSAVGEDLIAALRARPEPGEAKAGLIRLLAAYPAAGKPGKKWREDAGPALAALHGSATVAALLDAALDAAGYENGEARVAAYLT